MAAEGEGRSLIATAAASACPLCGQANACAMEAERRTGIAQPPCWCLSAAFDARALERIPEASRGVACICERCATQPQP
jgi:hypothetical protein